MPRTVTPISIKRAADMLGLKVWPVYEMTEEGELPFAILNGRRLVALEDVLKLKEAQA
jgi:excisionase family DNA binding protein